MTHIILTMLVSEVGTFHDPHKCYNIGVRSGTSHDLHKSDNVGARSGNISWPTFDNLLNVGVTNNVIRGCLLPFLDRGNSQIYKKDILSPGQHLSETWLLLLEISGGKYDVLLIYRGFCGDQSPTCHVVVTKDQSCNSHISKCWYPLILLWCPWFPHGFIHQSQNLICCGTVLTIEQI